MVANIRMVKAAQTVGGNFATIMMLEIIMLLALLVQEVYCRGKFTSTPGLDTQTDRQPRSQTKTAVCLCVRSSRIRTVCGPAFNDCWLVLL